MKRRPLVQLRESFLPLTGLIACLAGRAASAGLLFGAYLLVRLCALCPDGAYRLAAADELNARALARYRKTAALLLLSGTLLATAVSALIFRGLNPDLLCWLLAGAAALGCRLFFAFLAADREGDSAALGEALLAVLLAAALLLGEPGQTLEGMLPAESVVLSGRWGAAQYCAAAAWLALVISWLVTARIAPPAAHGPQRPAARVFARAPLAVLRGMLCPLLLAGLVFLSGTTLLPTAFVAWALYAGASSLYRRSPVETPPLVSVFVPIAALLNALALLPALLPELPLPAAWVALEEARFAGVPMATVPVALAAVLTLLMHAHPQRLVWLAAALLALQGALPCLPVAGKAGLWASLGAGAMAVVCVIPMMREALVSVRAARLRRKRGRPAR